MKLLTIIVLGMTLPSAASAAGGEEVVLVSPAAPGPEAAAALDKFREGMAARGVPVTAIPAEELQDARQAALTGGSSTVVKLEERGGKSELRASNALTGKDMTNSFIAAKPAPAPAAAAPAVPATQPQAPVASPPAKAAAPEPRASLGLERNHIGLSVGMSNLKKNEDTLNVLAANNAGAGVRETKTTGRFRLFYEHYFGEQYGLGLAAGISKGGQVIYDVSGRTLNIDADPKSAMLYLIRRFGGHFGLYLGGGADFYSLTAGDSSNLAGFPTTSGNFSGSLTAPHGEAGLILGAGSFSLRLSLKQTFGGGTELSRSNNGTKYRLTVVNGKNLSYKAEGQPLGANEKYFQLDPGGFASAVTINYAFAGW